VQLKGIGAIPAAQRRRNIMEEDALKVLSAVQKERNAVKTLIPALAMVLAIAFTGSVLRGRCSLGEE
jgi:hypothetical protein